MNLEFFQSIPFFKHLTEKDLRVVMNFFERKMYKQGDTVIQQGEEGDGVYVVLFGEVSVHIDGEEVARLKDNDFFGEIALITNEKRTATVKVESKELSAFFLSRMSFDAIKEKIDPEIRKEILNRIQENFARKNQN